MKINTNVNSKNAIRAEEQRETQHFDPVKALHVQINAVNAFWHSAGFVPQPNLQYKLSVIHIN